VRSASPGWQASEYNFPQKVLLSRSRFIAPATQPCVSTANTLSPAGIGDRERSLRYLIRFKGIEFYINVDTLSKPNWVSSWK